MHWGGAPLLLSQTIHTDSASESPTPLLQVQHSINLHPDFPNTVVLVSWQDYMSLVQLNLGPGVVGRRQMGTRIGHFHWFD